MRSALRRNARLKVFLAFSLSLTMVGAGSALGQSDPELTVPADVLAEVANAKVVQNYIVVLDGDPVVAYEGGIRGLAATAPAKGQKLDPNNPKVIRYQEHLIAKHNRLLAVAGVGVEKKLYDYTVSLDGFAAQLSGLQAAQLSLQEGVLAVVPDELRRIETISTPEFLGLTEEDGPWDMGYVGENVIIGIIDSGTWPENPSFSDRTGVSPTGKSGKLGYRQIPGWHGKCTPGEAFNAADCNQKLIGAQWYGAGFGGEAGVKALFPYEFWSPRAAEGHGVHVAGTAGGNSDVLVDIPGIGEIGTASGIAPRARIASYKACWGFGFEDAAGCYTVDTVAAIDQAVADGVDVINYSISGTLTNFLDAVEVSFLFAARAGVFVAAAGGNEGPGASTVNHPSPWITTVAAGTHDRYSEATVTLGDGSEYTGASFQFTGAGPADLVYGGDVAAGSADMSEAALCYPDTLDPDLVSGKIVVCDRGVIPRVFKSAEVARAGGIGMIHANTSPTASINADLHSVPTVHVSDVDGAAIKLYMGSTTNPTAEISVATPIVAEAPGVIGFSNRGPVLASGDVLKPDILAPGVDIIAAVSPVESGRDFDSYSGTSMASPHVAGLAAVIKSAYPRWSPAMIKSAILTTAGTETNEGNPIGGGPFDYGSGHIIPGSALDPGLVYDAGYLDYLGFLCGTGQLQAGFCPGLEIDPSDLNQPNIAIGELAGLQTVVRTVTNVGPAGTYEVSVDAPPGVDVIVEPAALTLARGESASYEVTFTTNETAVTGSYTFGSLTWTHGPHNVTSQLVVRPVQLAAPNEVSGTGVEGALSYDVTFGYSGAFSAAGHGLEPASLTEGSVVDDPANDINTALATGIGVTFELVSIPDGTAYSRISLFDDFTDGNDDLDLYVFGPASSGFPFVGGSGSPTSAEQVDLLLPTGGLYIVAVHGWQTDGPDANYTLFDWSVSATPGGSLMIDTAPSSAILGATDSIDVSWEGLLSDTKYLGAVSYSDAGGLFGLTLVGVSTE